MKRIVSVTSRTPVRLDVYLTTAVEGASRARIQQLIKAGRVLLNGERAKAAHRPVRTGDVAELDIPRPAPTALTPEAIPLDILYEDDALLLLDKPAGMVVHPAAGHWEGTLVHALLHHCGGLPVIGGRERPGLVHRLDRDTSGVMVIAKTDGVHRHLSAQFKGHTIDRMYLALVCGKVKAAGVIHLAIGRDRADRKKISSRTDRPREAETRYTIRERFKNASLLEVFPQTGRTHQIRVHLAHIGHPVVGDRVYGGTGRRSILPAPRQMLHAARLGFIHPISGLALCYTSPPPADMQCAILAAREETLRSETASGRNDSGHAPQL